MYDIALYMHHFFGSKAKRKQSQSDAAIDINPNAAEEKLQSSEIMESSTYKNGMNVRNGIVHAIAMS